MSFGGTEHFNTGPGWPKTRFEVASLPEEKLDEFMGMCDVDPAEPSVCLSCYAYQYAQEHEKLARPDPVRTLRHAGYGWAADKIEELEKELAGVNHEADQIAHRVIEETQRAVRAELDAIHWKRQCIEMYTSRECHICHISLGKPGHKYCSAAHIDQRGNRYG
jgi:hypothetical protein